MNWMSLFQAAAPYIGIIVAPVAIAGLKKASDSVPKNLYPVIAPGIGVATALLATMATTGHLPDPSELGLGGLAGAGGVWLREMVDQNLGLGLKAAR